MEIQRLFLTPNAYSRPQTKLNKVTNIVIHWVGNANSSALANRNYFESLRKKKNFASSHYIVGLKGEIIQCIPESEVAYHASKANSYSIGIETCHPDWGGKFNDQTYASLIELCVDLCKRYALDPETALIRHYDVTRKICPKYYVDHPEAWKKLKQDVKLAMSKNIDTALQQALECLIKLGININVSSWNNVEHMNMKYVKALIERIGQKYGKKNYRETINFLVDKGCITARQIWDEEKFDPRWVRALLIKCAATLEK